MSRKTLMQALISEGVVQEVIAAAFIKAELHDMEMRVQASVYRAMERAREDYNPFEKGIDLGERQYKGKVAR